jgi:hypothetical protein
LRKPTMTIGVSAPQAAPAINSARTTDIKP